MTSAAGIAVVASEIERTTTLSKRDITVIGGGVLGLWQTYEMARRGHRVTLHEATEDIATGAASRFAGAMLAPYCEAEAAEPVVRDLGLRGLTLWREAYPDVICNGTLVVASSRDRSELIRFARMTNGHREINADELAGLEPDLAGRFARGLFYSDECHMPPRVALQFLADEARKLGARIVLGEPVPETDAVGADTGITIDCRGIAARDALPTLRGVRGERLLLRAPELTLSRPVRLLHPRYPLYVVPWGDGYFMVGATVIERDDDAPMTVRSALELLGMAYALHPGFAEASILELSAGVRPAFPDNIPKAIVRGRQIYVNGAFRHGFLLSPVLAHAVADYLEDGAVHDGIMRVEN